MNDVTASLFASRTAAAMTSLLVTAMATGAIMLAGDYYRGAELLPTQLAAIAVPIGLPLLIAGQAVARRRSVWCGTAAILAVGWGYVVYSDTRPDMGGGPSFAVVAGWFASMIALIAALLFVVVGLARR